MSPVVEAKSPTTNKVVGAPTAIWIGAKENRTVGEVGAAWASRLVPSVSRREVATVAGAVPAISIWSALRAIAWPCAVRVSRRSDTSLPAMTSGTRGSDTIDRVPKPGLTGKSPLSTCLSHETVCTVATMGAEVGTVASHSASASIRDPPTAAGVAVPLIQPFQSRGFRFESNSQRVLDKTAPL